MNKPRSALLPLCLALLLSAAGCATRQREVAPAPIFRAQPEASAAAPEAASEAANSKEQQKNTEELKRKLSRRAEEVAELRLQLLVKQAEINQLLNAHEQALQEAARNQARLRSLNSKADAVAKLAEATLLVNDAREQASGDKRQTIDHAEDLLATGRQELQAGNYNGAAYLADKARSLLQAGDELAANQATAESAAAAEVVFATPLRLRVRKQSNVREKPGRNSRVLFQLPQGSMVQALGYSGLWIHLVSEDDRQGWIYYYLLEL